MISPTGLDLLERCLRLDPHARLTAEQCESHPFWAEFPPAEKPEDMPAGLERRDVDAITAARMSQRALPAR